MILAFSIAVAVLFGAGSYLLLKRDLIRLIVGMVLIGNAANLFIMATALRRGEAPVLPADGPMSDPMVQSMTLTAIVISFSTTALMLALVYRVYGAHSTVSIDDLAFAEESESQAEEADDAADFLDSWSTRLPDSDLAPLTTSASPTEARP